jgi:hypothetical protein
MAPVLAQADISRQVAHLLGERGGRHRLQRLPRHRLNGTRHAQGHRTHFVGDVATRDFVLYFLRRNDPCPCG